MADLKIRRVRSRTIYRGHGVRLTLDRYRASDGRSFQRETIQHPASVVILPILEGGQVVMIRQFRHALNRYILEIPAGTTEPGEPLIACARRELAEETGFSARRWKRLLEFYPAPGVSTERMVLYRAEGLRPGTGYRFGARYRKDKDEYITLKIVSQKEAVRMVRKNQVVDAKSILGILFGLGRIRWGSS